MGLVEWNVVLDGPGDGRSNLIAGDQSECESNAAESNDPEQRGQYQWAQSLLLWKAGEADRFLRSRCHDARELNDRRMRSGSVQIRPHDIDTSKSTIEGAAGRQRAIQNCSLPVPLRLLRVIQLAESMSR